MKLEEAKQLKPGDYIHAPHKFNADGTPMRARVTSVKTWKRSPGRIEIRYKRGLYEYGLFTESELNQIEKGDGR